MGAPISVGAVRSTLEKLGLRPSKGRGQNFLVDASAISRIITFANIGPEDRVLEIGPGLGAISYALAEKAKSYTAVDCEEKFCAYLQEEIPRAQIICGDVRKLNIGEIAPNGEKLSVVSNVPYSISSEVLLWILDNRAFIRKASLLLQREFAERVAATLGKREGGPLTVRTALLADTKLGSVFGGDSFSPRAEVDSRLLEVVPLSKPRFPIDDRLLERICRGVFTQRRKVLLNSLVGSSLVPDKAVAASVLQEANIEADRRPETLTLEEFVKLAFAVEKVA